MTAAVLRRDHPSRIPYVAVAARTVIASTNQVEGLTLTAIEWNEGVNISPTLTIAARVQSDPFDMRFRVAMSASRTLDTPM